MSEAARGPGRAKARRVRSAAWLALLVARAASAEPTVVLVETRGGPALPALASQVELHATRRAAVQTLDERAADPLTYAERAAQLVASGEASIVIWIAKVDHGYLVFAAGRWPGRALIELVRADEAIEPAELERTIALKIAGLLDTLLAPEAGARAALGLPPGSETVPGAQTRPARRWRIEVAALAAREPHERGLDGRTALSVGRAWAAGPWLLAPALAAHWQPSGTIERPAGFASLTELGAALAVEADRGLGRLQVFARPRLVLAALLARGESADGRRGGATVQAPYAGVEVGARRGFSEAAQVGLVAGFEVAMIHHEFLIDRETVLDLGRARLHVGLSLTVAL